MTGRFVIEPLGGHDRSAFSCGAVALDRYFRERASQDVKRLMASCFVLVEATTRTIAGYYTLAATSVPATSLPIEMLKRLPRLAAVATSLDQFRRQLRKS